MARAAGRIMNYLWKMMDLIDDIEQSEHPRATEIAEAIKAEGIGFAPDIAGVVQDYLTHPRVKQRSYAGSTR
jgi:hypothetical protein